MRLRPIRARTIPVKRLTRAVLRASHVDYPEGVERPRTRGECVGGARPCVFVGCRHNLYLSVNPETGSIKLHFPDLEPHQLAESCSLDVADRGALTLEEVAQRTNLTRERARQIEIIGLIKLKRSERLREVAA